MVAELFHFVVVIFLQKKIKHNRTIDMPISNLIAKNKSLFLNCRFITAPPPLPAILITSLYFQLHN